MAKTDTDLQELKDLINSRFDAIDKRFNIVERKFDKLEERVKTIEESLLEIKGKMTIIEPSVLKLPDLAEKVGELKNWRQIALVVITGTFGSLFGWFLRGERSMRSQS